MNPAPSSANFVAFFEDPTDSGKESKDPERFNNNADGFRSENDDVTYA